MSQKLFAIEVSRVCKTFKNVQALNTISLNFSAGHMHGVIGPDGAGKTTLMRIILNLLNADSGSITFTEHGKNVQFNEVRDDIAYMPQQESLYGDLSVQEHLEFFKDLYGIPEEVYQHKSKELLEMTQLSNFIERPAGKLSGGMYKKLGLICALLRSPKIIILDEPTNGVDPISRREFWSLLYRLLEQKILIIMTTAYMDEAERCSYVHLIDNGSVITTGEPKEILAKENVANFDQLFIRRNQANEYSQG